MKKCHKKCIFNESVVFGLSLIRIHNIGNLLKSKKAYSQWQDHLLQMESCSKCFIDIGNKKVLVFKVKNKSNVENNSK